VKSFGRFDERGDRREASEGYGVQCERDQQARSVNRTGRKYVFGLDCANLLRRLDDYGDIYPESSGKLTTNSLRNAPGGPPFGGENRVPAIEERLHIVIPKRPQQRSKLAHRYPVALSDLDPSQQCGESRHGLTRPSNPVLDTAGDYALATGPSAVRGAPQAGVRQYLSRITNAM